MDWLVIMMVTCGVTEKIPVGVVKGSMDGLMGEYMGWLWVGG